MQQQLKTKYFLLLMLCLTFGSITAQDLTPSKDKQGKYGYKVSNTFTISPKYDLALPFVGGVARVMQGNRWGLIDTDGDVIIPIEYDYIGWSDDSFYRSFKDQKTNPSLGTHGTYDYVIGILKDQKWGLFDIEEGSTILDPYYHSLSFPKNKTAIVSILKPYKKTPLHGLIGSKGREIIRPQYQYMSPNADQSSFVVGREARSKSREIKFGLITQKGEQLIPIVYRALRPYKDYIAVQDSNYYWSVFDQEGIPYFEQDHGYDDIRSIKKDQMIAMYQGKWGMINDGGEVLIPFDYKSIQQKDFQQYEVQPFMTWIEVDKDHQTQRQYHYEDLSPISTDYFRIKVGGKYGVINHNGKMVKAPQFLSLSPFEEGIAVARTNTGYAVLNRHFQEVISGYDSLIIVKTPSKHTFIKALKKIHGKEKWGLFDRHVRLIIPFSYQDIKPLTSYRLAVKQYDKWGYMNVKGSWLIRARYDKVNPFVLGRAVVQYDQHQGIIDLDGRWVVEPMYTSLEILSHGLALYQQGDQHGLLDLHHKTTRPLQQFKRLANGYIKVKQNGLWGLMHVKGRRIIPMQYSYVTDCGPDSLFTAYKEGKYYLYNLRGQQLIKGAQLKGMGIASEGLVSVKSASNWGYMTLGGYKKISSRYASAKPFSEGLAAVKIGNRWGYITTGEHLIATPKYTEVKSFKDGYAMVKYNGKWGFINTKGQQIIKAHYDKITPCPQGWITHIGKYKGFINKDMKEVFYPKYDTILFKHGYLYVKRASKWGLALTSGKEIIPTQYNTLFFNPYNHYFILGKKMPKKLIKVD